MQLVPLDLVGDERRDQVVEVRGRGEQHRHRPVVAVEPAPAAGGRLDRVPLLDPAEARALEDLRLLAHDDHRRLPHARGQPPHRVQEGAEVDLVGRRERMQARVHRAVRRLEHAQQRLARRPQQRRVRAVVELDLVGDQPGRLPQRPARESRRGRADGGRPSAAKPSALTLADGPESPRRSGRVADIPVKPDRAHGRCFRMARRRTAFLLLVLAGLAAGCGAMPEPAPRPSPPPEVRSTENQGALKAASWRAAAAAEAERLRRLRARDPARPRLAHGHRRAALRAADGRRITPRPTRRLHARVQRRRAPPRAGSTAPAPPSSARSSASSNTLASAAPARAEPAAPRRSSCCAATRSSGRARRSPLPVSATSYGPAVFQYYPGRGMQLQPLASWGKAQLARAHLPARPHAARRRAACPVRELRAERRRACSRSPPTAATSSPGSTTSAGAAARRRGSAA